jgi:parallel beta-helix repeat protein
MSARPAAPLVPVLLIALLVLVAAPAANAERRSFKPVRASSHGFVFKVPLAPGTVRAAKLRIGNRTIGLRLSRVRHGVRDHVLHLRVHGKRGRAAAARRGHHAVRLILRTKAARHPARRPARQVPATPAPTPTAFVSPTGSDANPGTAAAPWQTLGHASEASAPGAVVELAPGDYGAVGTITRLTRSGQAGSPITFIGRAGAAAPRILGQLRIEGEYIEVHHVLLDGPTGRVAATSADNPGGEDVKLWIRGDHAVLAGSEVRGSQWHAGVFVSDADDVRIADNDIHDNGDVGNEAQSNLDHGIYWASGSGEIVGNQIARNVAYGVHLYPDANHVTVADNEISGNRRGGVIVAEHASNNTIVDNAISGNREGLKTYALDGGGNVARGNRIWANWEADLGDTDGLALEGNRLQ